jgi:hypothetical protein
VSSVVCIVVVVVGGVEAHEGISSSHTHTHPPSTCAGNTCEHTMRSSFIQSLGD